MLFIVKWPEIKTYSILFNYILFYTIVQQTINGTAKAMIKLKFKGRRHEDS